MGIKTLLQASEMDAVQAAAHALMITRITNPDRAGDFIVTLFVILCSCLVTRSNEMDRKHGRRVKCNDRDIDFPAFN